MVKSRLCDYSGAYILVKGNITIFGAEADDAASQVDREILKNCAPLTDCISQINNT